MAVTQAAEKHGHGWRLTWYLRWPIYSSTPTRPHSQNSQNSCKGTEFKDVLPWNISEIIKKAVQISTRIVMNYAVKRGILLWVWWKFNGNWDKKMIRKKKRTTSEGIKKSKRAGLVRSQSGIRVGKLNHVSKVIWDRKITKVFTRSISFTRKG